MSIIPDMIGLTVRDMGTALRFYRLLELAIPEGMDGEPHVEVITANGYRIAWDTVAMAKSIYPDWVEPVGQAMALAFKCGSPAEVDQAYARITAAGYKSRKAPWDAFWGQRYAVVEDPDGNGVDLFAPM
jgi:uncharacterized glyoxalase superfamily protein PhnB